MSMKINQRWKISGLIAFPAALCLIFLLNNSLLDSNNNNNKTTTPDSLYYYPSGSSGSINDSRRGTEAAQPQPHRPFRLFLKSNETRETCNTKLFSLPKSGLSKCLDGTKPAYYLRRADKTKIDAEKKWHVHFEGGGWCFTPEQCAFRAKGK